MSKSLPSGRPCDGCGSKVRRSQMMCEKCIEYYANMQKLWRQSCAK